jgi:predicted aspartyl protease
MEIFIDFAVSALKESGKRKIRFLVDTGATRSWLPEAEAKKIGVKEEGKVPVELADGSIKDMPYGFCYFIYNGEKVVQNVIIGGCEPLAGVHTLQDFRMIIDLEHHTIKRGKALRAK